MMKPETLKDQIHDLFQEKIQNFSIAFDSLTVEIAPLHLLELCISLREEKAWKFEVLLDVCGVDYLEYGKTEWRTEETTYSGFSRGVEEVPVEQVIPWNKARYAVVYHLLSLTHNLRLRIKVRVDGDPPMVPSVIHIWNSANWYERETFDLYGIVFDGHPDLRRLLTDYGFSGHPFRKDFPLIGEVELRYDATKARCVYEPVSIRPRVLVPKVIRNDPRYKK